jgi:adenylate cyclase
MAEAQATRRLAAILAADVAGYTRLMGEDEEGTLASLSSHLGQLIKPTISETNGRIVKTTGDGILVEFASVVDAVQCAVAIQKGMAKRNADQDPAKRLEFRIGINLGDVIVQDEDIYGDGVNVAARLESLTPPGSICVSRAARDQIRDKLPYGLEDWGEVSVKNVARPVRTFRLLLAPEDAGKHTAKATSWLPMRSTVAAAAILVAAVVGMAIIWLQPWHVHVEAASMDKMAYALPDKPSLAVIPFTNLSNDPEQRYFADGLTEDIITDISKVSGIFVVAKGSTTAYTGKNVKVKQVAEDLGIRYVLEGSVRRSGHKLRITAQLADAIKGAQIWADRYDREVRDVFAVQSDITRQVVRALAVTLKANEHDRIYQKYVTNIDAYDAFVKARAVVGAPTRKNIERGEQLFERVIELDPKFAGGYAGLSFNYSVKSRFNYGPSPKEDAKRALEFANKAIAADKDFAWSHIALAGAYLAMGEHDRAVEAARTAVAIQPNGFEANLFMGFYLNFAGRSADAVRFLETAANLSRIDTIRSLGFLGMAYFTNGDYANCEKTWVRRFERFGHRGVIGNVFLAASQVLQGKTDKAAATAERFHKMKPGFRMSKWTWLKNYKLAADRKRLFDAAVKAGIAE